MRITSIDITPVTVRTTRPCASAMGSGNGFTKAILELHTDAGLTGLGEVSGSLAAQVVRERFAPAVIGLDPRERGTVRNACLPEYDDYGTPEHPLYTAAFAGIEIALWDILGKSLGLPVYKVLGGAVRAAAPFVAYAYTVDLADGYTEADVPAMMAQIAREQIDLTGASMFEFKIGRHSVECDIETTRAVRLALGNNIEIGVDSNMRYSTDAARHYLSAVRDCQLANAEELVENLYEMEKLRIDFAVPASTHCTNFSAIANHPHIDSVVGGLEAQGGIARTLDLAARANSLGRRYWLRSCLELGVSWAAMVHVGMACRLLERPAQALGQWVEDDLIEGEAWAVRDGGVTAPDQPGLGVTLDRDALDRHHALFHKQGELSYFDRR